MALCALFQMQIKTAHLIDINEKLIMLRWAVYILDKRIYIYITLKWNAQRNGHMILYFTV